jgi:hypothetical protein
MTITVPFSPSRCYADVVAAAAVEFARLLLLLLYTPACTTYTCVGRGYIPRAAASRVVDESIDNGRARHHFNSAKREKTGAPTSARESRASTHTHTYKIERLESQNFVLI